MTFILKAVVTDEQPDEAFTTLEVKEAFIKFCEDNYLTVIDVVIEVVE